VWVGKAHSSGPVLTIAKMICVELIPRNNLLLDLSKAHADRKNNCDLRLALVDFTKP
jgi:hypothetical protein